MADGGAADSHALIAEYILGPFAKPASHLLRTQPGNGVQLAMALDKAVHCFRKRRFAKAKAPALQIRAACLAQLGESRQAHSADWRMAFTVAQCILATSALHDAPSPGATSTATSTPGSAARLAAVAACVDEAFIRGGPDSLPVILAAMEAELRAAHPGSNGDSPAPSPPPSPPLAPLNPALDAEGLALKAAVDGGAEAGTRIARVAVGDVTGSFNARFVAAARSVVVHGLQDSWAARDVWRDLGRLERRAGHRLIPIEVGTWPTIEERLVSLSSFLRTFMAPASDDSATSTTDDTASPPAVAYCAQHALFNQMPFLTGDFDVPVLLSDAELPGRAVTDVNAWWGTAHTMTPLHWDAYDNLLAQVVGYKYVRLYAPDQTKHLYPRAQGEAAMGLKAEGESELEGEGGGKGDTETTTGTDTATGAGSSGKKNLSRIDDVMGEVDAAAFPLFAAARHTECVLGPGDTLFIPEGTWHYVRSLTPSMSVNFWF